MLMLPFAGAGYANCALMLVVLAALMMLQVVWFIYILSNTRNIQTVLLSFVPLVLTFVLFVLLTEEHYYLLREVPGSVAAAAVSEIPMLLLWAVTLILSCFSGASAFRLLKQMKHMVTVSSVAESLDNLPVGLCFASADGRVLLVNRKMEELSFRVSGRRLSDCNRFWERICSDLSDRGIDSLGTPAVPALCFPGGEIRTFIKESIDVNGKTVTQLLAYDSTDLHSLGEDLRRDNAKLEEMNNRLKKLNENIDEYTREEEILSAKIRIHDELGEVLLASKRCLRENVDAENVTSLWKRCAALLRRESLAGQKADPLRQLTEAAAVVGVALKTDGDFPVENMEASRLLIAAGRECLTNAVRHAGATELSITIRDTPFGYSVRISDNGPASPGIIREGGGLMGLRRNIEEKGGSMSVETEPEFALLLEIPGKGDALL